MINVCVCVKLYPSVIFLVQLGIDMPHVHIYVHTTLFSDTFYLFLHCF